VWFTAVRLRALAAKLADMRRPYLDVSIEEISLLARGSIPKRARRDPSWWTAPVRPWRLYPRTWRAARYRAEPQISSSGHVESMRFSYDPYRVPDRLTSAELIALVLFAVLVAGVLVAWLPSVLVTSRDVSAVEREGIRNDVRGVLVTFTAVAAAAATLTITIHTYRLSREGQITDRMSKAVDQLGAGRRDVRVGGLMALIRIAEDSARDRPSIIAILCTFVQERTATDAADLPDQSFERPAFRMAASGVSPGPPNDVEAALVGAIGLAQRLNPLTIQLARAQVPGAHLAGMNLSGANLAGIRLDRAFAWEAVLEGSFLMHASLRGAWLTRARLREAYLADADLRGCDLAGADLDRTELDRANLEGATGLMIEQLRTASLEGTILPDYLLRNGG
jgi:uncharacterized protein YjbI with pentapeptide repeats